MKRLASCPTCNNQVKAVVKVNETGAVVCNILDCGHMVIGKNPTIHDSVIQSAKGKRLRNYQLKDLARIEEILTTTQNCGVILNHEMGGGKTIISTGFTKLHPETLPVVIFCKSKLKMQWFSEIYEWTGCGAQILEETSDKPVLGYFQYFIISADSVARMKEKGNLDELQKAANCVIIDECQTIKNSEAARTEAILDFCKDKKFIFPMSGTPFKNNAAEFYNVMNLVTAGKMGKYHEYLENWLEYIEDGKTTRIGGIRKSRVKDWNLISKQFMIRRTRAQVLPDLPAKQRNFIYHDLGEDIEKAYVEALAEFNQAYKDMLNKGEEITISDTGNILAKMSKLRRLTGIAKIEPTVDFVTEHLQETDRPITIFYHHVDVGNILFQRLRVQTGILGLSDPIVFAPDAGQARVKQMVANCARFHWPEEDASKHRVLIASTLSGGEGLNLQRCADAMMMERQWEWATEEQAEDRFPRPGQEADKITITYPVALNSIDELLARIIEQKRSAKTSVLDGVYTEWNKSSMLKQLAEALYQTGAKGFSLSKPIKYKNKRKRGSFVVE